MKKNIFLLLFLMISGIAFCQNINENCIYCKGNTVNFTNGASALGTSNISTGLNSFASGYQNEATGNYTFANGFQNKAIGSYSVAMPFFAKALGERSLAFGYYANANGSGSLALGTYSHTGENASLSIAIGSRVSTQEEYSIVLGYVTNDTLKNNISKSLMIGFESNLPTLFVGTSNGTGTTGKVGIGNVTDPHAKLHIRADAADDATLRLEPGTGKVSRIYFSNTDDYYLQAATNQNMIFRIQSGKNFSFENGKIVSASLQITSGFGPGKLLQSDASGNALWTDPSWIMSLGNLYRTSGNVGIGYSSTSTLNNKLEVNGYSNATSGYKVGNTEVINSSRDYSGRNGTLSGNLAVTGTSSLTGNVGIGTSPTEKLDVNGWARTSSGYKVGTSQVIDVYRNFSGNNGAFSGTLSVTNNTTFAGKVGIGTSTPIGQFQTGTNNFSVCLGKLDYSPNDLGYAIGYVGFNGKYSNNSFVFDSDGSNGGSLVYSTIGGTLHFVTIPNTGSSNKTLTNSEIAGMRRMTITGDGNIGIGISNPSPDYKLSVAGKILAEELQIQLVQDWYDNVFEEEYNLMDLNELESFVKQNNHLPDIPSEAEVKENGIRVGEMNALLLKKVEELTLYIIEQQKMLENQHTEINNLKKLFESKNNQ